MKVKMITMSAVGEGDADQHFIVPADFDHQGVLDGHVDLEQAMKRIIAQAETAEWGERIVEALNGQAIH